MELDSRSLDSRSLIAFPYSILFKGQLMLPNHGPRIFVAHIRNHVEFRSPQLKLTFPINERRKGHRNEERTSAVTFLVQGVQKGDGLDGLAQAHLVGQDDIRAIVPTMPGPTDTLQLIRMQIEAFG